MAGLPTSRQTAADPEDDEGERLRLPLLGVGERLLWPLLLFFPPLACLAGAALAATRWENLHLSPLWQLPC